jgi:hypothetical protein
MTMVRFDPSASCASTRGRATTAPTRAIRGAPCIKSTAALAITLALTACAGTRSASNLGGEAQVVASNSEGLADVEQVSIRSNATADRVVCRRTEPTGSRISVERCESKSRDSAADKMVHDQMLRDVEEMRMQELRRQQASQDAAAAMMQRRLPQ